MGVDHWSRIQAIFLAAIDQPDEMRRAYVREVCGGETDLENEVQSLLDAHFAGGMVPGRPDEAGTAGAMADLARQLTSALADRYVVERVLGLGGMATVFLAQDVRHEREVAIKVLRPDLVPFIGVERFLREIRVTAGLQHPHILPLFDSGEADALLFYVMPYIAGGSLRARLDRVGQLSVDETLRITDAVAAALDHAHGKGIIHRDIKPENILLQGDEAIVADFGIALALAGARRQRLTGTGVTVGTPAYMSPEQVSGEPELDARCDVYALACVVYEMLAGEPPFTGPNSMAVMMRHAKDPVPPLSTVRATLGGAADLVMNRALAKTPIDRYAAPLEFAAALRASHDPEVATSSLGASTPGAASQGNPTSAISKFAQQIRFCTSNDGVQIAYATAGSGPPLVKTSNWLSHLELDAESPMWRHWWKGLSRHHTLIRYDERGCGLSDWKIPEMSLDAWLADLEAVVDASGVDRFALLGISRGGATALAYAVKHPERVSHLVLHGSFARGKFARTNDELREEGEMQVSMVKYGWGRDNPGFRQAFTTMFFPDASAEQQGWFNELQRVTATPENAARSLAASLRVDVLHLAPHVSVPTLVLHSRKDAMVPFESGRQLARKIPGARMVSLPSRNHIPLEHEAAWPLFLEEIHAFLGVEDPES